MSRFQNKIFISRYQNTYTFEIFPKEFVTAKTKLSNLNTLQIVGTIGINFYSECGLAQINMHLFPCFEITAVHSYLEFSYSTYYFCVVIEHRYRQVYNELDNIQHTMLLYSFYIIWYCRTAILFFLSSDLTSVKSVNLLHQSKYRCLLKVVCSVFTSQFFGGINLLYYLYYHFNFLF